MHKNAIKIVGGVKFSKKIPQNVGFFVQKLWDFQHWGGDFRPLTSGHTGQQAFFKPSVSICFWFQYSIFGAPGAKLIMAAEDEPISDSEKVAPKTLSI